MWPCLIQLSVVCVVGWDYLCGLSGALGRPMWLVGDGCGRTCAVVTWLLLSTASYVVGSMMPLKFGFILGYLVFNLFLTIAVYCHHKAMTTNPGTVPLRDPNSPALEIDQKRKVFVIDGKTMTVCRKCQNYRPRFAHHCSICGRCVRRMDHHCPWINNCVGEDNQKYFMLFCLYVAISSFIGAVMTGCSLAMCPEDSQERCGMDSELNPLKVILVLMECFVFGEQQQDFCVIDDHCVTIGFFTVIMFSSQLCTVMEGIPSVDKWQGAEVDTDDDELSSLDQVLGNGKFLGSKYLYWLVPILPRPPQKDNEHFIMRVV
eukprot:m.56624 g.56624  ORF g.56624 m.56624 type:complete len:317 (-) comp11049_c0_seq2:67-1017(-)